VDALSPGATRSCITPDCPREWAAWNCCFWSSRKSSGSATRQLCPPTSGINAADYQLRIAPVRRRTDIFFDFAYSSDTSGRRAKNSVTTIFHGDDEYLRFLDVFFVRTVLSLVEIGNPFERLSAAGSGKNYLEHYHLYEILCASLCIVIISSLFTAVSSAGGASRRQQEQPDTGTHALRKVTILIKAYWLASSVSFGINLGQVQLRRVLRDDVALHSLTPAGKLILKINETCGYKRSQSGSRIRSN